MIQLSGYVQGLGKNARKLSPYGSHPQRHFANLGFDELYKASYDLTRGS